MFLKFAVGLAYNKLLHAPAISSFLSNTLNHFIRTVSVRENWLLYFEVCIVHFETVTSLEKARALKIFGFSTHTQDISGYAVHGNKY